MLTIDQIDKIKKEIMWRTDITAAYGEEEIAAIIEVFELAKERVISTQIQSEERKIMNDVYERSYRAAKAIWEDLCDRSVTGTDQIDDETRDEMLEEWRDIILTQTG